MRPLENKVAIVTGANSGIGRGCALTMAAAGAKIIATGRNLERGADAEQRIRNAGSECYFVPQDVTQEADWQRVIAETLKHFGKLDILVNNAGDALLGPINTLTRDTLDFLLAVDVEGPFLGMKYAWPHLKKADDGVVVNMSSITAQKAVPGGTAYCTAKGAQAALTRAAATQGAAVGIRVISMHPGFIWTEGVTDVMGDNIDEFMPRILASVPMGEAGEPRHIGDAMVYLCSESARSITGIEFNVDGGQLA